MAPGRSTQTGPTRERVVAAASALAASGGADAVSIRAVSAATGIQAPTIYRLFGSKQGLLDAVTEERLEAHVLTHEAGPPPHDPVDDLRQGWDGHVAYALGHPHLYRMTYVEPHPGERHPAAVEAEHRLIARIQRIAEAGRLRVSPERALLLVEAAGAGTALTLLSQPEDRRDGGLSEAAREIVITAITTDAYDEAPRDDGPAGAARHLLATLHQVTALTTRERALLQEWLDRIAQATGRRPSPRARAADGPPASPPAGSA
ncbi:MAG: TetR/AcrR family transcriptional regulator [Lapillicoccus sp.]